MKPVKYFAVTMDTSLKLPLFGFPQTSADPNSDSMTCRKGRGQLNL